MISNELRGWLEMLAGAGICLYTANRGARGVFANLRNRGEGLVGAMLIVLGVQTHLDRLNVDVPWLRWVPLGLGFLGVALIIGGKAGQARAEPNEEAGATETPAHRTRELTDATERGMGVRPSRLEERVHRPR